MKYLKRAQGSGGGVASEREPGFRTAAAWVRRRRGRGALGHKVARQSHVCGAHIVFALSPFLMTHSPGMQTCGFSDTTIPLMNDKVHPRKSLAF